MSDTVASVRVDDTQPTALASDSAVDPNSLRYAGFWMRFAAALLDFFAVALFLLVFAFLLDLGLLVLSRIAPIADERFLDSFFNLIILLALWGYFGAWESSRFQATPGKLALGIRVVDLQGKRLSLPRALLRNIAKLISKLTCSIGYIMAGVTSRKQALHDLIAGCLVIEKPS